MIVNLRAVYNLIVAENIEINKQTLKQIHSLASVELVTHENCGNMRNKNLDGITGTLYVPLQFGDRLDTEMTYLFKQYHAIQNPFEKAIYLHNNLCYLQYFEDCNKRTARAMQFLSFKNDNIMPLVMLEDDKAKYRDYRNGVAKYYDTGSHKEYIDFFIETYKKESEYLKEIAKNRVNVKEILECDKKEKANHFRRQR